MIYTENVCTENPQGCSFQIMHFAKGLECFNFDLQQHVLLFCQKGYIRITSNFFKGKYLCAGEFLFIPRGSDYHGTALSETIILIQYFNNAMCRAEDCILSFLYTHKHIEPKEGKTDIYNKLIICKQLSHLIDGVSGYINDQAHESALWGLKHKELIWLLSK